MRSHEVEKEGRSHSFSAKPQGGRVAGSEAPDRRARGAAKGGGKAPAQPLYLNA